MTRQAISDPVVSYDTDGRFPVENDRFILFADESDENNDLDEDDDLDEDEGDDPAEDEDPDEDPDEDFDVEFGLAAA